MKTSNGNTVEPSKMYETENDIPEQRRSELNALMNQQLANAVDLQTQIRVNEGVTDKQRTEVSMMEKESSALTVGQRAAIGFAAGVVGAAAVVACSYILFWLGVSGTLGVTAPLPLKSPDIYKPLFWGGLWGVLFGLFVKAAWKRLYLVGFLYVLAPLAALFLFFLPVAGAG